MRIKLFGCLLLFATHFNSFGQDYVTFPDSKGKWNIQNFNSNHEPGNGIDQTHTFFIAGKVIYNGIIRSKLWTNSSDNLDTLNSKFIGLLREENKKVYYYPEIGNTDHLGCDAFNSGVEYLLYDFNLSVGDTINKSNNNVFGFSTIESIDSINIFGQYRKRYHISTSPLINNFNEVIIEGIGSNRGLFSFGCIEESPEFTYLICFSESDSLFKTIRAENVKFKGGCYYSKPNNTESFVNMPLQLHPNPATSFLKINADKTEVLDISGKLILTTSDKQIDLSDKPKGLYFVRAQKDGMTYYSKVVLE